MKLIFYLLSLVVLNSCVVGRKHHLDLENDERRLIHISTFGFFKRGSLEVNVHRFFINPPVTENKVKFTVDRTLNNGINPYSHNIDEPCGALDYSSESIETIEFMLDFKNNVTRVKCSSELQSNVKVCKTKSCVPMSPMARQEIPVGNVMTQQQKRSVIEVNPEADNAKNKPESISGKDNQNKQDPNNEHSELDMTISKVKSSEESMSDKGNSCNDRSIEMKVNKLTDGTLSYSFSFVVYIAGEDCEGLYSLYYHNCARPDISRVTMNVSIVEENQNADGRNFLSAGEIPLPALYFMMSLLFFMAGCFWAFILKKSRKEPGVLVFKIHYLMGTLVFVKSLSLLFHSINYHYIQLYGTHVEGWAVLYYITHLLKGALLFLTILLIGTGYAFVKHLLSDKEKKLFMIVIPLQVLANVAQIIIEESEEGDVVHNTWKVIFISVDLLCCGAILFPVVWSIKHLQEASQTDGKAASSLRKLKLFRHFYIMIVCYIYFTRIIVQMLLRITVPFQYTWVDDMFLEMTTFIFFVLTGYKFRPMANNPYLAIGNESDDEEAETALTESGLTEGLSKRGYRPKKKTLKEIVLFDPNEDGSDDDEEVLLEKTESSHDFD